MPVLFWRSFPVFNGAENFMSDSQQNSNDYSTQPNKEPHHKSKTCLFWWAPPVCSGTKIPRPTVITFGRVCHLSAFLVVKIW